MSHIENTSTGETGKSLSIATPRLQISAAPHPFRMERVDLFMEEGLTIAEVVARVQPDPFLRMGAAVFIGDMFVPEENWHRVRPKTGYLIQVRITVHGGGGGKNPLKTILSIAILAAGAAFGPALGLALVGPAGLSIGGLTIGASAIGSALIGIAGNLLISAIAPPPSQKIGSLSGSSERASQYYSIESARNRVPKFERIPRVLGRHRMYPDKIGEFTEIVGDDQYYRVLLSWGYGPLDITSLKIGETAIENYDDVEIETRYGYADDEPLTLFPADIAEESFSVELRQDNGWQTRTTDEDADEISIDIAFPSGLTKFGDDGSRDRVSASFEIQYSLTGAETWQHAGFINLTEARPSEIRRGLRWNVDRGQYDVRIKRTSVDHDSDRVFSDSYWIKLRTITNEDPISFAKPIAKTAIRIKSSGQLAGVLDTLNGVVHSILPIWNGVNWNQEAATSNPASQLREILQGDANHRPEADAALNLSSIQDFYDDCVENGFEYNSIIDYPATVMEMSQEVASAGRASLTRPDGRWSVIMDRERVTPVQHFSPRNTWSFEGQIIYPEIPHAFRVRFANAEKNWQQDEVIVYDDGYTSANATIFLELQLPGITDSDLAWKHGRFHIAQMRLRRFLFSFWCDFENFTTTRGDLALLSHDVIRAGLASGRIKEVTDNGTHATAIVIDEPVDMEASKTYGVQVRLASGSMLTAAVNAVVADGQTTLTFSAPIALASAPEAGDHFSFGETDQISREVVITWIETGGDMTARIHSVDHAVAIYSADQGTIPAWTSSVTAPTALIAPTIQSIRSDGSVLIRDPDGSLAARILITFRKPSSLQTDVTGVEARFRESDSTGPWSYSSASAAQGEINLMPVETLEEYEYQIRYTLKDGTSGAWSALATHTVVGKSEPPGAITNITAQQNGESVTIRYRLPTDLDLKATEFRYIRA